MRLSIKTAVLLAIVSVFLNPLAGQANNLVVNGDFKEVDEDGFPVDWIVDWDWSENTHKVGSYKYIKIREKDGSKRNVLEITQEYTAPEPQIASKPIPHVRGNKYRITFDAKSEGGNARVYVRGYKWKPGIRPYPNPSIKDLREIYKGVNIAGFGKSWKSFKAEFPLDSKRSNKTSLTDKHLRPVRFICFFIIIPNEYCSQGSKILFDNISIRKR